LPLEILDLETVRERVVQVAGKWIVLSVADGLMLVHQHRAHACVLYSQMLQRLQHNGSERQSLLFPDIWDVNTEDMPIVEQMQDDLSALGFELERMSKFSFSLSAVPAVLPAGQAVGALQQMVAFVRETGMKARDKWRERMALSLAYSGALPSGRVLPSAEMENLLKQLFALPSYQFTPDGKTVVKYISEQRLTQLF
jgi:DNA mismatch repair protein MutL